MGCGGRGSVGAQIVRRAVSVSEQQRADERRFNAFAKTRRAAHGPLRALVRVAAYGEVVWSWHPLLMLSLAEAKPAQPGEVAVNPLGDGDKKEFVAGEQLCEVDL